jgi:heme-degrading monooxygenase HmoA
MFVSMNLFSVHPDRCEEFESAWRERDSYLSQVDGFVRFALLRGEGSGEYNSHTTWRSRGHFEAWAQSDAFRNGHRNGIGDNVLAGHPKVVLYEGLLEIDQSPAG